MQKQSPILFNTSMVIAIIDGTKRLTRRTTNLDDINKTPDLWQVERIDEENKKVVFLNKETREIKKIKLPYGGHLDLLWGRETSLYDDEIGTYKYAADFTESDVKYLKGCWKPSIYMPKEAARIWLQINMIKVERLHDITEADAVSEGVQCIQSDSAGNLYFDYLRKKIAHNTAKDSFQSLWISINGIDAWNLNPWVFAYYFDKVENPN